MKTTKGGKVMSPTDAYRKEVRKRVPASVRVRRESAVPKAKPKPSLSSVAATTLPTAVPSSNCCLRPQSIDDSYMAFLEDRKALGALDT